MTTKIKKLQLKVYKLLNIKRCSTVNRKTKRQLLKEDPNYIYNNRNVTTYTPEGWLNSSKVFTCQDGKIIPYGFEENFKHIGKALEELGKETIKGESIN